MKPSQQILQVLQHLNMFKNADYIYEYSPFLHLRRSPDLPGLHSRRETKPHKVCTKLNQKYRLNFIFCNAVDTQQVLR